MKKILGLLSAATLLFAACNKDETSIDAPVLPPDGKKIELTGSATTRSGDVVYPFKLYAFGEGTTLWNNSSLYIDGSSALFDSGSGTITTDKYWPQDGGKLRFLGALKASDASAVSTVDITSTGMVNLTAGEGLAHDYLLSNNLTAGENDTDKGMKFRHVMSQLVVNFTLAADVATECNIEGTIAAGKTTGTYPIFAANDAVLATGGTDAYNMPYGLTIENETAGQPTTITKTYYLIADGSNVSKMTGVKVNGVELSDVEFRQGGQPASILLQPGTSYNLNLNLGQLGLVSAELSLSDWNEEVIAVDGINHIGKKMTVLWDSAGADVTAVELVGTDNTIFAANVVKDPSVSGKGYVESASDVSLTIDKVYGYHGEVRVEMVSPLSASDKLWSFTPSTSTDPSVIELKRVLIATAQQLLNIDNGGGTGLPKHHYQVTDLDLGVYNNWYPVGTSNPFSGTYVGGGFKINNFNNPLGNCYGRDGLFGLNRGYIEDVHVVSGTFNGKEYSGVICASNETSGTIKNCINEATIIIHENNMGGIAGYNDGKIIDCINRGTVNFNAVVYTVGGITGWNNQGEVMNCSNYGTINAYGHQIGGIAGASSAILSNCTNYGKVIANGWWTGGIAGSSSATILECKNYGELSGQGENFGGITGRTYASITDCENYGKVAYNGKYCGGIAGLSEQGGLITGCTNNGVVNVNGQLVGGVVGYAKDRVTASKNNSPVTGYFYVGGVAGDIYIYGSIDNCVNKGNIDGTKDETFLDNNNARYAYVGGICGNQYSGLHANPILNCENSGSVSGVGFAVGGIAGSSSSPFVNCSNTGDISGYALTGGIGGNIITSSAYEFATTTTGCVNRGAVSSTCDDYDEYVKDPLTGGTGGIIGHMRYAHVSDCKNYGKITGYDMAAGIVGYAQGNVGNSDNYGEITARRQVGGIVGELNDDTGLNALVIDGCTNNAKIWPIDDRSFCVGGICGELAVGTVKNSRNLASVNGYSSVGGIAGNVNTNNGINPEYTSSVISCINEAPVTATGQTGSSRYARAGGIAGQNMGYIISCENKSTGTVESMKHCAGGIAADNMGTIVSSHNYASVKAHEDYAGGITGRQQPIFGSLLSFQYFEENLGIYMCSNHGDVTGGNDYAGGLAGGGGAIIASSFNTGNIVGNNYVGGLCGLYADRDFMISPDMYLKASYNTGRVAASGQFSGGLCGRVQSAPSALMGYESNVTIQGCYNTGSVSGGYGTGVLIGELTGNLSVQAIPVTVSDCFWAGNVGLSDIGIQNYVLSDVRDNLSFSTSEWPADNASRCWGIASSTSGWGNGEDVASGNFWNQLGTIGSTSYPKLWWE